ncbi:hypothetical protein AB6M49_003093 [Stenotrophomonas maltophilia]
MSNDKTTLADVQPGGRVRLGDQAERARFYEFLSRNPLMALCAGTAWQVWQAALSAQPSPGKQAAHCPVKHCGMTYARVPADGRCHACGATVQPSPGGQDALATLIDQWMARADRHEASALEADSIGGMQMAVAVHEARAAELNAAVHSLKEALAARQPVGEPVEMSPEFTDTARAAIAWVLWHHQGGSSPVGQPLRFSLGMGQHDRMTDHQIAEAKRFAAWAGVNSEGFHHRSTAQAVDLGELPEGWGLSKLETCYQLSHGNDIIGNFVGPDAEENAAIIARVIDSQAVGNG